jgi:hypothetical protein
MHSFHKLFHVPHFMATATEELLKLRKKTQKLTSERIAIESNTHLVRIE